MQYLDIWLVESSYLQSKKLKDKKNAEVGWGSGQTLLLIWQVGMDRQTIAIYQFSFISLTINCLTRFGRLFTLNSSRAYFFLYSSISKSHSYASGKYSDVILSFYPKRWKIERVFFFLWFLNVQWWELEVTLHWPW